MPLKFFVKGFPYNLFGLVSENPDARVYLLGSDGIGRDLFIRLLYGAQISLSIGFVGITITMVLGFLVGCLSGYFFEKFNFIGMRLVELLMVLPGLYLLLALRILSSLLILAQIACIWSLLVYSHSLAGHVLQG